MQVEIKNILSVVLYFIVSTGKCNHAVIYHSFSFFFEKSMHFNFFFSPLQSQYCAEADNLFSRWRLPHQKNLWTRYCKVKYLSVLLIVFCILLLTPYLKLKFWGLGQFPPGSDLGSSIQLCSSLSHVLHLIQFPCLPKCDTCNFLPALYVISIGFQGTLLLNPGLFYPFSNLNVAVGYCIPLENSFTLFRNVKPIVFWDQMRLVLIR